MRALAAEPDLEGLDDPAVLELATADARILVTRNSRDFAPIARTWAESGREHAGAILIWSLTHRQLDEIAGGVDVWLEQIPDAERWPGLVASL